ncbi:MAG: sulfatase [Myxococcota bacterium]
MAIGPLAGALLYVGLFVYCVLVHRSAEYMGVEDHSVTDRLVAMFEDRINAQQLGILGLYAAIGAVVGSFAGGWIELLRRVRGRPRRGWRHFGLTLLLVVAIHSLFTMRSMALHPAMYAPATGQSFLLKALFALAVDGPPRITFDLLLAGLGLSFVAFTAVLAARRQVHPAWPAGLGLAAGIAVAVLAAPRRVSPRALHPDHPNVLVLAVDSMRADVLRPLPDGRQVVPNILAFAEHATTFTRAIPTVPRTYPSWASILTGQYPQFHGVRHMFPLEKKGRVIAHGLPDLFAAAGYRTGVVSDFAGDVFKRGDFGFQTVDAPPFTLASNVALGGVKLHVHLLPYIADLLPDDGGYKDELGAFERFGDPSRVEDDALDFVADDPDRPFFLVAFFSAGHFPFASPTPFWQMFGDASYDGPSRFLKDSFGKAVDLPEQAHLRDLYHGAVAASDAAIGRVLERLRAAGQLDVTVVVITADHGENVYEYGLGIGHGDHLYGRTTLEVPLIVDWPGNPHRGTHVDTAVSLLDIAPTLLARAGLASTAPPETLSGVDLATPVARPIFSEIDLWFFPPETHRLDKKRIVGAEGFAGFDFDPHDFGIFLGAKYQPLANLAKHRMVLDGDRKLLYIPTRDGVRWELYAPLTDPGDEHDLAAQEPETVARLKAELYAWMLSDPTTTRVGDFVVPREETRP